MDRSYQPHQLRLANEITYHENDNEDEVAHEQETKIKKQQKILKQVGIDDINVVTHKRTKKPKNGSMMSEHIKRQSAADSNVNNISPA